MCVCARACEMRRHGCSCCTCPTVVMPAPGRTALQLIAWGKGSVFFERRPFCAAASHDSLGLTHTLLLTECDVCMIDTVCDSYGGVPTTCTTLAGASPAALAWAAAAPGAVTRRSAWRSKFAPWSEARQKALVLLKKNRICSSVF